MKTQIETCISKFSSALSTQGLSINFSISHLKLFVDKDCLHCFLNRGEPTGLTKQLFNPLYSKNIEYKQ